MQVQIFNYLSLMKEYKMPLFLHGIKNVIKNTFVDLKEQKIRIMPILRGFKVSERMIYHYKNGTRGVPIHFLEELIGKSGSQSVSQNLIQKCFDEFSGVSSMGSKPVNIPKIYSDELAYISGVIIGDGHVSKRSEIVIWEETTQHSTFLCELIERVFSYTPNKYNEGNYFRISIDSAPIHFFFSRVIGIPEGKKKLKETVPKFINLSLDFKLNFLRGLFDSDGGVTISKSGKKSVLLSSVNKEFLDDISIILKEFDINFPKPYHSGNNKGFELRTFKKDEINKFNQKIGFLHSIKRARSNALIAQSGGAIAS